MADELLRLQSQVTALSTAWLYLAASVEMHGGLDPEGFERALLAARIPDPAQRPEAKQTIADLLDQLAEARRHRSAQ